VRYSFLLIVVCFLATACSPHGCQRQESRALFAADSLSRQMAMTVDVDTLVPLWQFAGRPLDHPRTIVYAPDGSLLVSDTRRHEVLLFTNGAEPVTIKAASFRFPYLAGFVEDTLLVFNPDAGHIDFVANGNVYRSIATPADLPAHRPLQYAAAVGQNIYFKTVGDGETGFIARLDLAGNQSDRFELPGPYWRHAGLLRSWDSDLLSLSGFRPVVDVIRGSELDTLALVGFDSPMLARSRNFVMGTTRDSPLLSASAAPAGDYLFVLNMRPGWLHIDVFNRDGMIVRTLTQPNPEARKRFYPLDLAVRQLARDTFEIAVILSEPEPSLFVYRWTNDSADL
jgi:hypothetical protein